MAKVRKRNGRLEEFDKNKIVASVMKAGATKREANRVANRVHRRALATGVQCKSISRRGRPEIASPTISCEVASRLREVNRPVANRFVRYRDRKLRARKLRKTRGVDRSKSPGIIIIDGKTRRARTQVDRARSLKKGKRYAIDAPELG